MKIKMEKLKKLKLKTLLSNNKLSSLNIIKKKNKTKL